MSPAMIGMFALLVAFVGTVGSVVLLVAGHGMAGKRQELGDTLSWGGRVAALVGFGGLTVCVAVLAYCFLVGDYTVLCAVNIGSREIILAENEQSANGERFLCCYGERNDIFEKFTECAVGDDYIDAALFFAERIKQDAERFRAEVEKLDIPVTVITQADCIPDHYKNDINGKIIAINPAILKPEYQRADRQLFLVTGGFGASANARGSAVFCKNLYDGKNTRYARMDVLGEVKPERMPDWAKEKAAAFSRTIQGKDHER